MSGTLPAQDPFLPPLQARRFVEEGHSLRLVVTFKGGREAALGREMVAFLLEQLEGESSLLPGLVIFSQHQHPCLAMVR